MKQVTLQIQSSGTAGCRTSEGKATCTSPAKAARQGWHILGREGNRHNCSLFMNCLQAIPKRPSQPPKARKRVHLSTYVEFR